MGGVKGPARVVKAFLFKYWHSKGNMAEDSQSLTRSKYRIRKEFSFLERQTKKSQCGDNGRIFPPSWLPNEGAAKQ